MGRSQKRQCTSESRGREDRVMMGAEVDKAMSTSRQGGV